MVTEVVTGNVPLPPCPNNQKLIAALTSVEKPELAMVGILGFLSFFGLGAGIIVSSALIHAADKGLRLLEEIRDR